MDKNRIEQIKQLVELTNEASQKQAQFFQHILIVSVSIFAILVSLRDNNPQTQYTLVVFVLVLILLTLGILLLAITVYDYAMLPERTRKAFHKELSCSVAENRDPEPIATKRLKRTAICQKLSLIILMFSLLLLLIYALLISFQ